MKWSSLLDQGVKGTAGKQKELDAAILVLSCCGGDKIDMPQARSV